jgi:hypothetical protein
MDSEPVVAGGEGVAQRVLQGASQAAASPEWQHVDRNHLELAVRAAHAEGEADRRAVIGESASPHHVACRRVRHQVPVAGKGQPGEAGDFARLQQADGGGGSGHGCQ